MGIAIHSIFTDYTYTLDVYVPEVETPEKGFKVIYVLDGLNYFDFARQTVALQYKNEPKTHISPAIIVSIAHNKEDMQFRRFLDFTGKASEYKFPPRLQGRSPESVGGANEFHHFITEEVQPYIVSNYPINPDDQTIYGHSLGGYYALWTLFNHPNTFRSYLAISPSIWWNDYEMWKMADYYLENPVENKTLFICAGEKEGFMVDDAKKMYEKLRSSSLKLSFYEALEENHASVVPTTMSRAIRFLKD